MTMRSRKFLGMIALIVFVIAYSIGIMALAVDVIGKTNKIVEVVFYVLAGFAWILPARKIIAWMQKPDTA